MQQFQQILNWFVPPLIAAGLAGIYALVQMWGRLDRHGDRLDRLQIDISEGAKRLDQHEAQLQKLETTLASIAEGVDWIKRTLAQAFDVGRKGGN